MAKQHHLVVICHFIFQMSRNLACLDDIVHFLLRHMKLAEEFLEILCLFISRNIISTQLLLGVHRCRCLRSDLIVARREATGALRLR